MKKLDLTGQRFGRLTVVRPGNGKITSGGNKKVTWICVCDCDPNKEIEISAGDLKSGNTKSCGCLALEFRKSIKEDLTGKTFGKWTVLGLGHKRITQSGSNIYWLCECSCEAHTHKEVSSNHLKNGTSTSCGCDTYEKRTKTCKAHRKHNTYDLSNEYGIGYTLKGEKFYFDKEDYDLIYPYLWRLDARGYVVSKDYDKNKHIKFHRLIMHTTEDQIIDHQNHHLADNRKINLRITNDQMNAVNLKPRKDSISGYNGVRYNKRVNKWDIYITVDGRNKRIGRCETKEEAIQIRKKAEDELWGEFSYNNSMKAAEAYKIEGVTNAQS